MQENTLRNSTKKSPPEDRDVFQCQSQIFLEINPSEVFFSTQKYPPDGQDVSHARVKYSCKKIFLKVLNLREKNVQSKNPHLKIEMFPMSGSKPSNSAGTSSFSTVYSKNLQRFCLKEYCQQ